MELFNFYRKIAKRTGWWYVILHFLEIKHILDVLKLISSKYGMMYQYEIWIKHSFMTCPFSFIIANVADFEHGVGKNYQNVLKKVFGVV